MRRNPDWRYEKMSRSEIDSYVKSRSSYLTSRPHTLSQESGKKIKFIVGEKDIEHLVSDAMYRAKGTLFISDISSLHRHFFNAKYVRTSKDTKGRKGVVFHYYKLTIDKREMYLNIMEDRKNKKTTLHSITKQIQ